MLSITCTCTLQWFLLYIFSLQIYFIVKQLYRQQGLSLRGLLLYFIQYHNSIPFVTYMMNRTKKQIKVIRNKEKMAENG